MRNLVKPALGGVLAALSGLAFAQLLAALISPAASPVITIGGSIIDATPTPVKEFAVRTVGTYDKPLLLAGILLGVLALAAVIGIVASRRLRLGLILGSLFGVLGLVATLTRPTARPVDALPSLLGGVVTVGLLYLLFRPSEQENASRRVLLLAAAGTAVAGGSAFVLSRGTSTGRDQVSLPAPASKAPEFPVRAGFYTPNQDFYRVDTSLIVPRIDVDRWRLRIRGLVDKPIEVSFSDLIRMPLTERDITLNCVSNEVGGPYIGTARWLGAPLAPLLRSVGVKAGADQLIARASDGFTIGTPLQTVLDGRDAMLCVGMNGEALPSEHGFPVRMLTPGVYGYAGACKWITELEVSTFDAYDAYWVKRGWARQAPVKTASRIDKPAAFARLSAGTVQVAGVAWAQHRGVGAVEIQVDDGPWALAELQPVPSTDTWVQWRWNWDAQPGGHRLRVRATDATGATQTEERATPFPDGATGWHTLSVSVA